MIEGGLTLMQIAEKLADGREYWFWTDAMGQCAFHKSPYPAREEDKKHDGAMSAITFRSRLTNMRGTPVLLLDELTQPVWSLERV